MTMDRWLCSAVVSLHGWLRDGREKVAETISGIGVDELTD